MLTFPFEPFPTLTTARLTLRQLQPADAPDLLVLRADPAVMQFIPRPLAQSVAEVEEHIALVNARTAQGKSVNWALARRDTNQVVGTIGYVDLLPEHFRAEVGYLLHPACQGQGLMQEALAAVLDYGFEQLHLHSVAAIIDPLNEASARLLERNGFVQEGHFRENEFYNGRFLDAVHYSLLEGRRPR
ncbi:GNAT family N-acetyltransferase [Hymenobacter algoricola]|uniref:GNAT family N-acetyltransferase n=1 Tax=Hymenobacter algoricola TaxID=486267 RepID=A0ABP7MJD4_9BACT